MGFLKRLRKKIKEKSNTKKEQNGHEYASSILLKGEGVEILELDIEQAMEFCTFDSFDQGIVEAITDYENLIKGVRNEINKT